MKRNLIIVALALAVITSLSFAESSKKEDRIRHPPSQFVDIGGKVVKRDLIAWVEKNRYGGNIVILKNSEKLFGQLKYTSVRSLLLD